MRRRLVSYLLAIVVFSLLILGYFRPLSAYTQDLGRHLLTGSLILETWSIPKTNLYSYTNPDFPFVNHHWLSEVIFSIVHTGTGDIGLQILAMLLIVSAFGLIYFWAVKKSSYLIASLIALPYLRVLFERTDIRPELFSFLFLSLFIIILSTYRERHTKWIYLLIPIQLLWVNMHIYFFVGIVVTLLFYIDHLIQHRANLWTKHTKILTIVLAGVLFVTLFNPNGLTGALYPLQVFNNYGYSIEENQTMMLLEELGFNKPSLAYFKFSILFLFFSLGLVWKKTRPIDWLLALTFSFAGIIAVRNLPLFVISTYIPLAIALHHLKQIPLLKQYRTENNFLLAALLLFSLFLWHGKTITEIRPPGIGVVKGAEHGVNFYKQNNMSGPLFNNFDIGSYLIYQLYPQEKVFIDGRPEAYPKEFIQGVYIPMQQNPLLFDQASNQYQFNTIFFSHTDQTPWANQFLKDILMNKAWIIVYLDDTVIILTKDNTNNAPLISKYGMSPENLRISNFDPKNEQSVLQLASFFNKTGLLEYELQMYHHLLAIRPNDCLALYNAAVLLSQKNDATAQIMASRYQQTCKN